MSTPSLPRAGGEPGAPIHRARYRRIVRYFSGVLVHMLLWEVLAPRFLGRSFSQRSATWRWRRIAQRYRALAVDLGGVLIKLGQFLSVRVDVLPQVVTAELAGLQDQVPPVPLEQIRQVVEAEYGRPLEEVFAWFRPTPEAAASLAQVHSARLPAGDEVVVKVQRPRIESIVETDLLAIGTAARWLKRYPPVRRRVNLDLLYDEFSRTTRKELDFLAEGANAERFAEDFGDDVGVRIPRIYAGSSTQRVLVMENVAAIKITDFEAIEAAGVDRREVARRLFDTYLKQVFAHNLVHADPHPGNLFVEPVAEGAGPARRAIPTAGGPFRLVFVDFGMVAVVPERVRTHIRDFLIGFATRDAARMVRAYQGAGVLLPGADLARLEQAEAELLDRYWGLTLQQVQQVALNEWQDLALEYRDILYEMPFQLPTDLLFVGRAVALLFGMATSLDPGFDPWQAIQPFARETAAQEARRDWREVLEEVERALRLVVSLPVQADRFLGQANRGELAVQTALSPEAMGVLRRVEGAVRGLARAVVFAALLVAAVMVYVTLGGGPVSYALFALAAVALLAAILRR